MVFNKTAEYSWPRIVLRNTSNLKFDLEAFLKLKLLIECYELKIKLLVNGIKKIVNIVQLLTF